MIGGRFFKTIINSHDHDDIGDNDDDDIDIDDDNDDPDDIADNEDYNKIKIEQVNKLLQFNVQRHRPVNIDINEIIIV